MSSKVQKLTDNPDSAADIAVAALMDQVGQRVYACLLYTSPSPRD